MKKYFTLTIVLLLVLISNTYAHSGKPKYHIIIDTDGAIDDFRSITTFLACYDIRTLAITGSEGTLDAEMSCKKVYSLLSSLYNEGIPVGIGNDVNFTPPSWRDFGNQTEWGKSDDVKFPDFIKSNDLMFNVLKNYNTKVILIALGSLNTYAEFLKKYPEFQSKIEKIIWYNSYNLEDGMNYRADPKSYSDIISLSIPLEIVSNTRKDFIFDIKTLKTFENINSNYAKQYVNVNNQKEVYQSISENHLKFWDDLVPVFLTTPLIFTKSVKEKISYYTIGEEIPKTFVVELIQTILKSSENSDNKVFEYMPTDSILYKKSIRKIINKTVEKYGMQEWRASVFANELHGHIGIYAIIGVKMGCRAREYFNVGTDNLFVESFAGKTPPFSCLNDGLQVSTGATIGHGLIEVSNIISDTPSAIFEFNNQKIKIELKKQFAVSIKNEINNGVKLYGFNEQYWIYIEELAIKYWQDFDKHNIFEITKL